MFLPAVFRPKKCGFRKYFVRPAREELFFVVWTGPQTDSHFCKGTVVIFQKVHPIDTDSYDSARVEMGLLFANAQKCTRRYFFKTTKTPQNGHKMSQVEANLGTPEKKGGCTFFNLEPTCLFKRKTFYVCRPEKSFKRKIY